LRIGGFGGAAGLAAYLTAERIDAVVDATHPFASRMSANAVAACRQAHTPLVVFTRPPWTREPGDRWIEVATVEDAAEALGAEPRTAFLTQGRLQLAAFLGAPQHRYIVRAIDRPAEIEALPFCKLILARGPFSFADELELMKRERIDALVTKNSGGRATYAKIEAARALKIEVVMVRRPPAPEAPTVFSLDEAMAWIRARRDDP
jgi:precorrin-6A/cobalt-precorrin-6A reductase